MKLIIVEGVDCVGKSTIIQEIVKYYDEYNITIRHFGRPKSNNPNLFQYNAFKSEVDIVKNIKANEIFFYRHYPNIIIWNRSHIGEYVYGQLYRCLSNEESLSMIDNIDNSLYELAISYPNNLEIKLIYLYASSDLLIKTEDGESIGKKIEEKEKELLLFDEIINDSNWDNIKINVSNNGYFRYIGDIMDEIKTFLNDKTNL